MLWPSGKLVWSFQLSDDLNKFCSTFIPITTSVGMIWNKGTLWRFQPCQLQRGAISTKYCASTLCKYFTWSLPPENARRPVMSHDFVLVACCTCYGRGVNSAMWSIPCRSWKEFHSLWKPEHLPDWWDHLAAGRAQSWWFRSIGQHLHFGDVAFGLASSTEPVLTKFNLVWSLHL